MAVEMPGEDPIALPLTFDLRERLAKPDMATIRRLRFLTTVDFPPFNFIDQSGKLSGFHVDLAREICRELNILDRCQIEAVPFTELQAKLDKGDGEVAAAGIRITPELRKTRDFSRAFMQLPARFVVSRQKSPAIGTPAELPAGQIGVVSGTTHAAMLARFFPALKPKTFESRETMLAALGKNDISAAFGDGLQLSFWLESASAENCCTFLGGAYYSEAFFGEGMTLMTRKDTPQITQALDFALLSLARKGRLNDIYLRYFPNGL
jgi:polar amino acid transport system substrate-binding protein